MAGMAKTDPRDIKVDQHGNSFNVRDIATNFHSNSNARSYNVPQSSYNRTGFFSSGEKQAMFADNPNRIFVDDPDKRKGTQAYEDLSNLSNPDYAEGDKQGLPLHVRLKKGPMAPYKYQTGGETDPSLWSQFEDSSVGKFVDARGMRGGAEQALAHAKNLWPESNFNPNTQAGRDDLGFLPGLGELSDATSTIEALKKGNIGDAAAYGAGLMLPFVPGGAVKKVVKPFADTAGKYINKASDLGKAALEKAGLTRQSQRLNLEGAPITQGDVDLNRTVSRSELENSLDRDRSLIEDQISMIEAEEMGGRGYISDDVESEIQAITEDFENQADDLRRLADEGGVRVYGNNTGGSTGPTSRGAIPEGLARKANPQNTGERIEVLRQNPTTGEFDITTQPAVSVGTNRSAEQVRQSNATLREFNLFGKETTRIDNPFSGESVRYQDIPGDFNLSGTGVQGLDAKPRVQRITNALNSGVSAKDSAKKMIFDAVGKVRNFSPKRAYRAAQETKALPGDSPSHAILPSYTPDDPTGSKHGLKAIRKILDDVSSNPGARFQDNDMSTDSFPIVLKALTKGAKAMDFNVKDAGKFVPLNSFGYGGKGYKSMNGPDRIFKGEVLPGYDPHLKEAIVDSQGKVTKYGAEDTAEMINEKIRALNKARGTNIPMARVKTTDYGWTDVEVPLIFADVKFKTKGAQRVLDESKAWYKRNPENIKTASKAALAIDATVAGAYGTKKLLETDFKKDQKAKENKNTAAGYPMVERGGGESTVPIGYQK